MKLITLINSEKAIHNKPVINKPHPPATLGREISQFLPLR